MSEAKKPKVNSEGERELQKAEKQFDSFDQQVKDLTLDRMNSAPRMEVEPQTKIAQADLDKKKDIYLKPIRVQHSREKFNEKFRDEFNFAKEYVNFIAENREMPGCPLELWTKKFPGQDAEEWKIPVNVPVWGPRYLAEQIKNCSYHVLKMNEQKIVGYNSFGADTGQIVVDSVVNRLDAVPASKRRSIFMGANNF